MYANVRRMDDPETAWELWRRARDELFEWHPQSPLPAAVQPGFGGLDYFDYDPRWRLQVEMQPCEPLTTNIESSVHTQHVFTTIGRASFDVDGVHGSLDLFWLVGYGGGLFVPFRDETSGTSTYGGGRYLLDTVKGADLGATPNGRLVLDFNFAYNPSCSYDPRWDCPLTPSSNHLPIAVTAGEKTPAAVPRSV